MRAKSSSSSTSPGTSRSRTTAPARLTRTEALLGAAAVLLATLAPASASAYPVHRRLYQQAYGSNTSCQLCHGYDGSTERNPYGDAWRERGENLAAFRAIERLDSDGDGAQNVAEIEAGSNPGDTGSTPDAPGAAWARSKAQIFIPLEQLELVFDGMERVEAAEVELSDAQISAVEDAAGVELTMEDRLPTFYFNVVRGRRDQVAVFHHLHDRRGKYALLTAVNRDGTADRIIIFRAPDEEGGMYLPYLRCLAGQPKDALPAPGEGECPEIAGRANVQAAIRNEVAKVLEIVSAHLSAENGNAEAARTEDAAASEADAGLEDRAEPESAEQVGLDFEAVEADGEASVMPASVATVFVLILIAFYLGSIYFAADWVRKQERGEGWPTITRMPAEARLAIALITLGLMLTQFVAIIGAYVQTQVVHESTWAYFQHLSEARLLGTSHSHLFGYTVTYGVLALLASMGGGSARTRGLLVAALLLTGPFDVASWWGQKLYSPRFDWLTMATGAVAGTASLVAAVRIWKASLGRE